jgi:hypothetical protein
MPRWIKFCFNFKPFKQVDTKRKDFIILLSSIKAEVPKTIEKERDKISPKTMVFENISNLNSNSLARFFD